MREDRAVPAHDPRGLSFGRASAAYERGRPDYPAAAVDWLLEGVSGRVVDVGAGTGKLTRSLVGRGLGVIAVEPSPGMRRAFRHALPDVTVVGGAAERLPLPDGCAGAVVAAQAWHWVDPALAGPEAARVLRPAGVVGLVWNDRDERDPWVAALSALLHEYGTSPDAGYRPCTGAAFGPTESTEVGWSNPMTADLLVDMIASRSYVIALPEARRAELLGRVHRHALAHPGIDSQGRFGIPYVTRAYRARRI